MNSFDVALQEALATWQGKELENQSRKGNHFFGAQRILCDKVLNCIVDLAHHSKLTSVQVLAEQTQGNWAFRYGEEILTIVNAHAPPAPPGPPQQKTDPFCFVLVNFNASLQQASSSSHTPVKPMHKDSAKSSQQEQIDPLWGNQSDNTLVVNVVQLIIMVSFFFQVGSISPH